MFNFWLTAIFVLTATVPAFGQVKDESEDQDEPVIFEEQLVVTASRSEQELVNAPAAVTVISSETIKIRRQPTSANCYALFRGSMWHRSPRATST